MRVSGLGGRPTCLCGATVLFGVGRCTRAASGLVGVKNLVPAFDEALGAGPEVVVGIEGRRFVVGDGGNVAHYFSDL